MKKRPATVTAVACLYVLTGLASIAYHLLAFRRHPPGLLAGAGLCGLGAAAVVAGIYLFMGKDWARWLALLWMAYHVVVSSFNGVEILLMHAAIFLLFAYILLGREARAYFRSGPMPAA
jgi:hypothetical protein